MKMVYGNMYLEDNKFCRRGVLVTYKCQFTSLHIISKRQRGNWIEQGILYTVVSSASLCFNRQSKHVAVNMYMLKINALIVFAEVCEYYLESSD